MNDNITVPHSAALRGLIAAALLLFSVPPLAGSAHWGTPFLRHPAPDPEGKGDPSRPYNYVNFRGQNPKYAETMQEINRRDLWQRHVQGR